MVTDILAQSGLSLGPQHDVLVAADDENPTGYWENAAVQELNEAVFALSGGAWFDPVDLPEGWRDSRDFARLLDRARELFGKGGRGFLCKDPRTSVNLPFWLAAAPSLRLVFVLRRPLDVARSLGKRRFSIGLEHGLLMWLEYTRRTLVHGAKDIVCVTCYEEWLRSPAEEAAHVAGRLGLRREAVDAAARKVVDRSLLEAPGQGRIEGETAFLETVHERLAGMHLLQVRSGMQGTREFRAGLKALGAEARLETLALALRQRCSQSISDARARAAALG
jgi:hypothetical protein